MRILLANKFYYPRGGDCIYTIELERLLKDNGHEVAVFSMQHPSNLASEYSNYFPSHVDFNRRNFKSLVNLLIRPFGSFEVRKCFIQLLNDFKPDIIHLNNIHSQLSPIIARLGHQKNIPVVWTLHDYKLVCPAYLLMNESKPCEACYEKKWSVASKKCIKHNLMASLVAYLEARFWHPGKLTRIADLFISPSIFLKTKMIKGGFSENMIEVINNFVNSGIKYVDYGIKEEYYCYVGRLSPEKGIDLLLNAATELKDYKLKIIGSGPLENTLASCGESSNVEFLGYKTGNELKTIISGSKFIVVPSNWFENNPLIILESLCLGTPVLGSDIGGIPELIKPGFNGILFTAGNADELRIRIKYLWENQGSFDRSKISVDAIKNYSSDRYYQSLINLYGKLLKSKDRRWSDSL